MALPVNVDETYPDVSGKPSVKLHQQHHDVVHGVVNRVPDDGSLVATEATVSATYARVIQVLSDGSADQTVRVNTALAQGPAVGTKKTVRLVGDFAISDSLVVDSRTTLDARDATITLAPTVHVNILKNRAVDTPDRVVTDVAITAGTKNLTSATAAFTAADVGRSVVVLGANVGGLQLAALIVAVADATTATLAVAAGTTVAGATCTIRTRDTDIAILGGRWVKRTNLGVGVPAGARTTNAHTIFLRHLDGVILRDVVVETANNARYSITLGDVTNFKVHSPWFPTAKSDGVHITGPASNGFVRDVSGFTGDDLVALCTTENNFYIDTAGDITDVLVDGASKFGVSTVGNAFKLAGYPGLLHDRIEARTLSVENPNSVALALAVDTGGLDVGTLRVDGVHGAAYITGGTFADLTVRNVRHTGMVTTQPWLNIQNAASITRLSLTGLRCDSTLIAQQPVLVQGTASVLRLHMDDVDWKADATYLVQVWGTAKVGRVHVTNAELTSDAFGGGIVDQQATATITKIRLTNVNAEKAAWCVALEGTTTTTLTCQGVYTKGSFYLGASAILDVHGQAAFSPAKPTIAAGGQLRIRSLGIQTDLVGLTRYAGDLADNVNGALACGAGPVVCNGVNWKHLYTGAIY